MRLAAHIGVKDEIELLPHCIAHLRTIGVDGTREYLQEQEGVDFHVLHSSNAAAIRECSADWALAIDADEFPLTSSGDLREALAGVKADDVLRIPRYNVVLGPQGPCHALPCPPRRPWVRCT